MARGRKSNIDPQEKETVKNALEKALVTRKMSVISAGCGVSQPSLAGFRSSGSLGEAKFNQLKNWLVEEGVLSGNEVTVTATETPQLTPTVQETKPTVVEETPPPPTRKEKAKAKEREEEREKECEAIYNRYVLNASNTLNALLRRIRTLYDSDPTFAAYIQAEYEANKKAESEYEEFMRDHVSRQGIVHGITTEEIINDQG